MSVAIEKYAPTAIIMALAAWCCWPYLSEPGGAAGPKEDGKLLKISNSLLSPAIKPVCRRDPFRPADTTSTVSDKHGQPTASPKHGAAATSSRGNGTSLVSSQNREAPTPSAAGRAGPAPNADIPNILQSLTLGATYIRGDQRIALINGRVCREGEQLAISNAREAPCLVKQIFPDKVVLQYRGQTTELEYQNPPARKSKPGKADK